MLLVQRYIVKQFLTSFLGTSLLFVLSMWLIQIANLFTLTNQVKFSFWEIVKISLLLEPEIYVGVAPYASLLSVISIYNKMRNNYELVAMQSTGMSLHDIAKPIYIASALIAIFTALNTIFLAPYTKAENKEIKYIIRNDVTRINLSENAFLQFKDLTIYLDKYNNNNEIKGIIVMDNTDTDYLKLITAKYGLLYQTEKRNYAVLFNGNQALLSPNNEVTYMDFSEYIINIPKEDISLPTSIKKRFNQSIDYIFNYNKYSKYIWINANNQIIIPLTVMLFTFVSICLCLLGQFSRKPSWTISIGAIVIVLAIRYFLIIITNNSNGDFRIIIIIYAIILALMLISSLTLKYHHLIIKRIFNNKHNN